MSNLVYDMMEYSSSNDIIINNHFKNWISQSGYTMFIIINKILRSIFSLNKYVIKDKWTFYTLPYDSNKFDKIIKLISILLDYCPQFFI